MKKKSLAWALVTAAPLTGIAVSAANAADPTPTSQVSPTAVADEATLVPGASATFDLGANDDFGDKGKTGATIELLDDKGEVVTADSYTFGGVTFKPAGGTNVSYSAPANTTTTSAVVSYRAIDADGNKSKTATFTVNIDSTGTPMTQPDTAEVKPGTTFSADVLGNDKAAPNTTLDASTLKILDAQGKPVTGEYSYGGLKFEVKNGKIDVTAPADAPASKTTLSYIVSGSNGKIKNETLTVTVPSEAGANEPSSTVSNPTTDPTENNPTSPATTDPSDGATTPAPSDSSDASTPGSTTSTDASDPSTSDGATTPAPSDSSSSDASTPGSTTSTDASDPSTSDGATTPAPSGSSSSDASTPGSTTSTDATPSASSTDAATPSSTSSDASTLTSAPSDASTATSAPADTTVVGPTVQTDHERSNSNGALAGSFMLSALAGGGFVLRRRSNNG